MKWSERSVRPELLNFNTYCLYIFFTLSPHDTNGFIIHDASREEVDGFILGSLHGLYRTLFEMSLPLV